MVQPRYKADIAGGSLKIPESRIVAKLLLDDADRDAWKHAIEVENVLRKRSPGTAKRQASLIKNRLDTMGPELWGLIHFGSVPVATHAVFAAAIKHSTLLSDFIDITVREAFRMFRPDLPRKLWGDFFEGCRDRDLYMPDWQESTVNKLGDSVWRILQEVGYIGEYPLYHLHPIRISAEVLAYLRENNEARVLRCIQVSP